MKKLTILLLALLWAVQLSSQSGTSSNIPFKMEELTSPKFVTAVEKAGGVCVIPLGIIEKHGPHLPLGSDLFESREWVCAAAGKEYAIVFPPYYFGQIYEARHQPGTMAYSNELIWKMLEETCNELSRNGLKKIILANGHGGSTSFLEFFCQSQLASRKDYIVVLFQPGSDAALNKEINSLSKATLDQHAGEGETAMMYFIRPDLVDIGAIKSESGLNQARLKDLRYGYTGIWWYANYPNHYASDSAEPNKKLGELMILKNANQLAQLIKYLKANNTIEQLQEEFFKRTQNPIQK
ncbi:MAG: creatininase family protein [Bacteroidales bacterium]|nr:creatininase family protein [Bacteroidales bacterium]